MEARSRLLALTVATAWALVAPAAAQSKLTPLEHEGVYVQQESGTRFPEAIGTFERTGLTMYGSTPLDVSAEYRLKDAPSFKVTAYSYAAKILQPPDGPALSPEECAERGFKGAVQAVSHYTPDAQILSTGEITVTINGKKRRGWGAIFLFPKKSANQPTRGSHLYVFPAGEWQIKFRFTYVEGTPNLEEQIETIFNGIGWPTAS